MGDKRDLLLIEVWSTLDHYEMLSISTLTLHKGIQDGVQELTRLRVENERLLELLTEAVFDASSQTNDWKDRVHQVLGRK